MDQRQRSTSSEFGSPGTSLRRRQQDFVKLATSGKYTVTATDNIGDFYVLFRGPSETPYEGGWWNVHVTMQDQYPYRSPSIGFANRIFHPNVDEASGSICLDVINQTWTPMYDLGNIFDIFLPQLLRYPNPSDPLNPEAAALSMQNPTSYASRVQQHVARYATKEQAMEAVKHLTPAMPPTSLPPPMSDATPQGKKTSPVGESPASTFSRPMTDSPPSQMGADDEVAEIDI